MTDIGRATVVRDAIAEGRGPLTLTDLAGRTGLPRSTVHRVVQSLVVLVRPDFHVYGVGRSDEAAELATGFLARLGGRRPVPAG